MRRFQQPLMIAVTIIVIIAFTWFYSRNDFMDRSGSGEIAKIYGKPVTFTQAQRIGRKFELAEILRLDELLSALAVRMQDGRENFIWNSLVLKHEAAQLNIEPSEDDVFAATKAMPIFQTNGVYDSSRFGMILQMAVTPRGFTADDLTDLIRDDLRLKRLKNLLGSTVAPSDSELRETYAKISQKTEASVVRLKLDDFLAAAQVPAEEVKKRFEERKAALNSEELRKVKYVAFVLPTTEKPLEPKMRAEALGKLAKQAEDFAIAMTEKDAKIEDVAAKMGVKVEVSADFPRSAPPTELAGAREAATAAFKLTAAEPNSDIISSDRGYFLLQLAGTTPPRPLTFEEVQPKLTDELKRDRAMEALNLKATEIRNKIDAEVKAGKSFTDAAQAAGVKAETFPAFSRQEPQMEPANSGEIMSVAGELNVKELSAPVPTPDGSVIVFVENRLPMDETKFAAEKAQVATSMVNFQKAVLFTEWLKLRRAAAQLKISGQS